jgi:hypothetical protein
VNGQASERLEDQISRERIEVLVRCPCRSSGSYHCSCLQCNGKGYVEGWLPHALLADLKGWIALGIRRV